MSLIKSRRNGCKDVFKAFLVSTAHYAGLYEFPILQPTHWIPNRLIRFSDAISCTDYDQWIHFYEDDDHIERIWRNPRKYLKILQKFNGVILPDFSVYRDMPFVEQLWNIFRSRAIGYWLQQNGVRIIVNIRYADERTYNCCCDGVSQNCVIAVGSLGNMQGNEDRGYFSDGLLVVTKELCPEAIVVYGSTPDSVFGPLRDRGITIIQFDSDIALAYEELA